MPHMNPTTIKPYCRFTTGEADGSWYTIADRPSGSVIKIETLTIANKQLHDEYIISLATGNQSNVWMKSKIPSSSTLHAVMGEAPYYLTTSSNMYLKVEVADGGTISTEDVAIVVGGLEIIS